MVGLRVAQSSSKDLEDKSFSGHSKFSQKQEHQSCFKSHFYSFMSLFTLLCLTIIALLEELPKFICPLISCVFIFRQRRNFIFRNQLENRLLGKETADTQVKEIKAFCVNISYFTHKRHKTKCVFRQDGFPLPPFLPYSLLPLELI